MPDTDLESTLRDLPRLGTLVKDRGYRQVWRFQHGERAFFLKFYPRGGFRDRFRRFFRGSPAMREFQRLGALQKAQVPAPRAVALMMGFSINRRRGDAVILQAIEPSVQLDRLLVSSRDAGEPIPDHRDLAAQIRQLVLKLGRAGLGHKDLHLGNLLLCDHQIYLLDGYAVRRRGLRMRDLLMLGHSVGSLASRTDLRRGWLELGPGGPMPRRNPISPAIWRSFLAGITRENRYFGRLRIGRWRGVYFKRTKYPHRWSTASGLDISAADWERAWPILWEQINAGQLQVLKKTLGGEVLAGQITLARHQVAVVVKHPRRRYWFRYLNEIGRGSRPRRAWRKSWNLLVRGLPTAWPLLLMEHRRAGYVTDAVLVCEQVDGPTLAHADLDAFSPAQRDSLLHRTGRILRQIEEFGFAHYDAKASNWIVHADANRGPMPVMIDVDGIRRRRNPARGIRRLLRSMHENPHYRSADSLSLCRGYAPFAKFAAEETKVESAPT